VGRVALHGSRAARLADLVTTEATAFVWVVYRGSFEEDDPVRGYWLDPLVREP
jgi:hypothetical protein